MENNQDEIQQNEFINEITKMAEAYKQNLLAKYKNLNTDDLESLIEKYKEKIENWILVHKYTTLATFLISPIVALRMYTFLSAEGVNRIIPLLIVLGVLLIFFSIQCQCRKHIYKNISIINEINFIKEIPVETINQTLLEGNKLFKRVDNIINLSTISFLFLGCLLSVVYILKGQHLALILYLTMLGPLAIKMMINRKV